MFTVTRFIWAGRFALKLFLSTQAKVPDLMLAKMQEWTGEDIGALTLKLLG